MIESNDKLTRLIPSGSWPALFRLDQSRGRPDSEITTQREDTEVPSSASIDFQAANQTLSFIGSFLR
jgi:hypothetical protein